MHTLLKCFAATQVQTRYWFCYIRPWRKKNTCVSVNIIEKKFLFFFFKYLPRLIQDKDLTDSACPKIAITTLG
jgi:hypothetical protein